MTALAGLLLSGLMLTQGCDSAPAVSTGKPAADPTDAVVRNLRSATTSGRGLPGPMASAADRALLARLYGASGYTPVWLTASGDLREIGKQALLRLNGAGSEGLRPEDYAAVRLDSLARLVSQEKAADPAAVARLDAGISLAVLHFLRDIHIGRVDPRSIGLAIAQPAERHDYVVLLGGALQEGTLDDIIAELSPPYAQYALLRSALGRYRARYPDSVPQPPLQLRVPLKPGESSPALAELARRLMLEGDLPDSQTAAQTPARYDGALRQGVVAFQTRHGLTPNGVVGKETLAELNVPLSWRVHQLELALERLRWIGDLGDAPFVLVNIPMFELTAWESPLASGPPSFRTGVIVGKALDTETPVLIEEMRYVIFQPYWNIPPSIATTEVLPALERDGEYLRKNNMEIVQGQGDDADRVELSGGAIDKVERGQLRIRQRPGPGNALGPIKFVFPNDQNVYLHGTPAEELFDRTRRDFSHGCVRVEDPLGLAEWVLRDQPDWPRAQIQDAMDDVTRISRRVGLPRPLTVLLFYTTAFVEADGTVRFARDIYGQDREVDQALHR